MTTSINQRSRFSVIFSSTRGPSATRDEPNLLNQVANSEHLSIESGELIKWRCLRLVPSQVVEGKRVPPFSRSADKRLYCEFDRAAKLCSQ